MGRLVSWLVMGLVCCLLLTGCPPDEDLSYPVKADSEVFEFLGNGREGAYEVRVMVKDRSGDFRQVGSLAIAYVGGAGVVVDDCAELMLVFEPTGERVDRFDGPVCWEDEDTAFLVGLEMLTLDD